MAEITEAQKKAVASIERRLQGVSKLALDNGLWFFVGEGFSILALGPDGERVTTDGYATDPDYVVGSCDNMPAGGGGW